jgi:polygalacturonase
MNQSHIQNVFSVRDFGASGRKDEDARPALQAAIDACAAAGGGMVYLPPGQYTSATLHLRSHVRIHIEAGATMYSSKDRSAFDKHALFYAEDVENITLEGRGAVNGQATYEWRLHDIKDWYIYPNQLLAERANMPLMRSFPTPDSYGNLVLFVRCADVHIRDLSFIDSPSWTMHLFNCDRLVIDRVYVSTSLKYGVWADGIDPDGCKDVRISNCTIETGDDALVFYSSNAYGTARACENITVTNCRLSSASSALKFCDGNQKAIRNVTIDNCVITNSNRGIAFMLFDGGVLENVVMTDLTIECRPFDWYWWGDADPIHFNLIQRSEIDPNIDKTREPPIGAMRNIIVRDVIARGAGRCRIHGSRHAPIENVTLDNVRLTLTNAPDTPLDKSGDALTIDHARNIRLEDIEIAWGEPYLGDWRRALVLDDVHNVVLEGVRARQAPNAPDAAAIGLHDVTDATIRNCKALPGTGTFIHLSGSNTRAITTSNNDTRSAKTAISQTAEVARDAVMPI